MSYSDKWLRYCEAKNEYFTARYEFMQDKKQMMSDLQQAMASGGNNETALRLLLEMKPKVSIVTLLPKILNIAIDSSGPSKIELARNVLCIYKDEASMKEKVLTVVSEYLPANDEWHYRRIAELYELLQYKKELADFILLCKSNENLEIQEVGDDFLLRGE